MKTHLDFILYEGELEGLIKCSRATDCMAAYRIPRMIANNCKRIEDLRRSGVYILIGEDENRDTTVYIGKGSLRANGNGVLGRMLESHKTKSNSNNKTANEWTEAIAFVSRLTNLDETALSYLEHHLCQKIRDAGRVIMKNDKKPPISTFSEEQECDMPNYIKQIEVLLRGLGLNILTPYDKNKHLELKYKNGHGYGFNEGATFIVFKNSKLNESPTKTCPPSVLRIREDLIKANKIKNWILQENIRMSSPSAAAAFVGGASLNGWTEWKTKTGLSLKEYSGT